MAEWKIIDSEFIELNANNFIEIAQKQPPEGDKTFIAISKGYYGRDEQKKFKANILFDIKDKDKIIKAIEDVS